MDANTKEALGYIGLIMVLILIIFTVIISCNSFYILNEDNYAVVTTLGNLTSVSQSGLHYKIPFIQKLRKVTKVIKGIAIVYDIKTRGRIDQESVMINKDFNFMDTDF